MTVLRVDTIAASGQTSENTGSVFFDGTGDYMQVTDNGDFSASGDITIECWGYLNSLQDFQYPKSLLRCNATIDLYWRHHNTVVIFHSLT